MTSAAVVCSTRGRSLPVSSIATKHSAYSSVRSSSRRVTASRRQRRRSARAVEPAPSRTPNSAASDDIQLVREHFPHRARGPPASHTAHSR